MKKLLLLLTVLASAATALAQEDSLADMMYVPDYAQIKKLTLDKNSDFYYPKVAERFANADTTLGIAEMQAFYYGYIYQPDYQPYHAPDQMGEAMKLLNKDEELTIDDYRQIVELMNSAIKEKPTEIKAYMYKAISMLYLEDSGISDTVERNKALLQARALFYVITASGDGSTFEKAFHITSINHAYTVMNEYGFRPIGQSLMYDKGHAYDVYPLMENEYGVDTMYFLVDHCLNFWSVKSDDNDKEKNPEAVTSVTIPIGSRFELELVKTKKQNSTFKVLSIEPCPDTLVADRDSLFRDEIPQNHIIGYFVPSRLTQSSERVTNDLIFIGNVPDGMLEMDTEIAAPAAPFYSTSNSGILNNCMMNEMWNDPINRIRISNIRRPKK